MQQTKFLVREPLLNSQERVLGCELSWHSGAPNDALREDDAQALLRFIGEQAGETGASALHEHALFLEIPASLLKTDAVSFLPRPGTVLAVRAEELTDTGVLDALAELREQGIGISLRDADPKMLDARVLALATHIEVSCAMEDFSVKVAACRAAGTSARIVARGVTDWQQLDACAALGIDAFAGRLHLDLASRHGSRSRELNPAQKLILQLMEMVRQGADIRELEGLLKRDAAVSYKLLRYINSSGFGLGCEIHSLRHAVALLGYSPLYRWLALLLATSSSSGYSPVLMQAAIVRGRFAELLGRAFLPKSEAENLFVAGMFSLLDRLLGVPMEDVLEKVLLSDAICAALLSRDGIYGPFLALAEACELNALDTASRAASLYITPAQVNQAHLSALAWAQGLNL